MSWLFSRALVEAFSEANSLDGERSAQLKSTGTDGLRFTPSKKLDGCRPSLSGTTSALSMGSPGADVLTWFLAAFPARRIPRRLEAATLLMTYGRRCGESWQQSICEGIWASEPWDRRVANGVAGRMERYEATGNGQIPIVAAAAWRLLSCCD